MNGCLEHCVQSVRRLICTVLGYYSTMSPMLRQRIRGSRSRRMGNNGGLEGRRVQNGRRVGI